jgi:hypothetical protein
MDLGLSSILEKVEARPILVDIGSSGAPPPIWDGIAAHSVYVGFDPDLRELKALQDGHFHRSYIINRAVTADESQNHARFYLTRSPFCSSTLRPSHAALEEYLFADLFEVERETEVPAATLASVLTELSLDQIDWLKTDSQGTDLRLFLSIPDELRSGVLAVDLEPGLIDAYEGEDLFTDVHERMGREGFWLSNLSVHGAVRMRRSTADSLGEKLCRDFLKTRLRRSPGWVEARYLRTTTWLQENGRGSRDFLVLWVFAVLDGQLGYALDVATEHKRTFPNDGIGEELYAEAFLRVSAAVQRTRLERLGGLVRRILAPAAGRLR